MRASLLFAFASALVASVQSLSITVVLEVDVDEFCREDPVITGPRLVFDGKWCDAGSKSATPTTVLLDASEQWGFDVQSRYDEAMGDFVITQIENIPANATHHWNTYVNEGLVTNGGCHTPVHTGDIIRFALES